jgi:bifunctional pyridoxal-dependent enzyme with beta-cystathionase and maltose regulon repressor activities
MSSSVRQLDSQKWGDSTYRNNTFILTIANMDIPLYEPLRKSITSRISMINNITYKNFSDEYYKGVISWYKRRHIKDEKINISKEYQQLNLIYLLIQNLTNESDGVLIMTLVCYHYVKIIKYLNQ